MWTPIVVGLIGVAALVFLAPMTTPVALRLFGPLIRKLAGRDPRCRIEAGSGSTIVLRVTTEHGSTAFELRQTLLRLHVRWTNESPMTGRRERSWSFFKFAPQQSMKDRIYDDLQVEHRNMMRS